MSFDRNSNFNREANFTGVKFGENKPVLETELNELQEIQNEAREELIRNSIPSGFTQLGSIDYDYMLQNENCIKLGSESIAYVNGYKITIPKNTIIDIGKAPEKEVREDLVFLEVWKEEVSKDSTLTKFGGVGQSNITNNIKDSRYPIETTRRYAIKWRIRHIANVDFSKKYPADTTSYLHPYIGWNDSYLFANIYIMGGNEDIVPSPKTSGKEVFRGSHTGWGGTPVLDDTGLWVGGTGDTWSKTTFKCVDGFVYAIPMFRVRRKPSCGKASPFEYNKLNPMGDYNKFIATLIEPKIERVTKEQISGCSIQNFASGGFSWHGASSCTVSQDDYTYSITLNSTGTAVVDRECSNLKPNTVYTLIADVYTNSDINYIGCSYSDNSRFTLGSRNPGILPNMEKNKIKVTITTPSDEYTITRVCLGYHINLPVGTIIRVSKNLMLLEGDWTNKEIPTYFTGLKSIGEDEQNLIKVENRTLTPNDYNPKVGQLKMQTYKGNNHLLSDNTIKPILDAKVQRNTSTISSVTGFDNIISSLQGDESLDFNTIQGRTICNVCKNKFLVSGSSSVTTENNNDYVKITVKTTGSGVVCSSALLKNNTTYTAFLEVKTNLSNLGISFFNGSSYAQGMISQTIKPNEINKVKVVLTTTTDNTHLVIGNHGGLKADDFIQVNKNIRIVEGDWSDVSYEDVPFFTGIKSVGEYENNVISINLRGKNLIDSTKYLSFENKGVTITNKDGKIYLSGKATDVIDLYVVDDNPLNRFYSDCIKLRNMVTNTKNKNKNYSLSNNLGLENWIYNGTTYIRNTTSNVSKAFCRIITGATFNNQELKIQFEEGNSATPYEDFKGEIKKITLSQPLRRLSSSIFDYIQGNKVKRRVGYLYLDGTEDYGRVTSFDSDNATVFRLSPNLLNSKIDKIYCDNFRDLSVIGQSNYESATISVNGTKNAIYFRVLKSNLETVNEAGFKKWLSQNPTTVLYPLGETVEEDIEPSYDKVTTKTYQLDEPLRAVGNVKDEIKDNVLVRRCGEITVTSSTWYIYESTTDYVRIGNSGLISDFKTDGSITTNRFNLDTSISWESPTREGCKINGKELNFFIKKSKLSELTSNGFNKWLESNPLKIIYTLDYPRRIPLREASIMECNISPYKRQFVEGKNYLRYLDEKVYDFVLNNKTVTRKVGVVTLTGDEASWFLSGTSKFMEMPTSYIQKNSKLIVKGNVLPFNPAISNQYTHNDIGIGILGDGQIRLKPFEKDDMTLEEGKAWLKANPITILYELKTPTTEEVNDTNYCYYPYQPINTYLGSMYVTNGFNEITLANKLKDTSIKVNTPFKVFTGSANIDNCNNRCTSDGYELVEVSSTKNLIDINRAYVGNLAYPTITDNGLIVRAFSNGTYRQVTVPIGKLKPNTSYSVNFGAKVNTGEPLIAVKYGNPTVGLKESASSFVFTTPNKYIEDYRLQVYCSLNTASRGDVEYTNIQVVESKNTDSDYIAYSPTSKVFENTPQEDVEDLRHIVSFSGFNAHNKLKESIDLLYKGDL